MGRSGREQHDANRAIGEYPVGELIYQLPHDAVQRRRDTRISPGCARAFERTAARYRTWTAGPRYSEAAQSGSHRAQQIKAQVFSSRSFAKGQIDAIISYQGVMTFFQR